MPPFFHIPVRMNPFMPFTVLLRLGLGTCIFISSLSSLVGCDRIPFSWTDRDFPLPRDRSLEPTSLLPYSLLLTCRVLPPV